MFLMGVRNIPRRRAQSALIVLGLMLSTLIVSAAFTTGDTLNYSVTRTAYDLFGPLDLTLNLRGAGRGADPGNVAPFADAGFMSTLAERLRGDPDLVALLPAARFQVPVVDERSRLGASNALMMGDDPEPTDRVQALNAPGGAHVQLAALAPGDVIINDTLLATLAARVGDVLDVYFDPAAPAHLRVASVVHATLLAGASGNFGPGVADPGGMVLPLATAQVLGGHAGSINFVGFTLRGGLRGATVHAYAAQQRIGRSFAPIRCCRRNRSCSHVPPTVAVVVGHWCSVTRRTRCSWPHRWAAWRPPCLSCSASSPWPPASCW